MTNIIAISKSTKNVITSTNPNDFIFHSSYNTFKILAEGSITSQTVNANPKTFTVSHGLDYAPNFYAFCKFPDGKTALSGPLSFNFLGTGSSPGTNYGSFTPEVDADNLYFVLTKPGANYSVDIKYYIFEAVL
jgi:hypothetical protein